jgi:hypothetical protein
MTLLFILRIPNFEIRYPSPESLFPNYLTSIIFWTALNSSV